MDKIDLMKIATLDFDVFENQITENPDLITKKDVDNRTLLHWCALKGRIHSVELLLSFSNCPVDAIDSTYHTPLILATLGGNLRIVDLLLKAGADIDAKNQQGHSSLQYACSKGWYEIVEKLLALNADVNVKDARGDSPLHRLASMGRIEILKLYLTKSPTKPHLDCTNREGSTPLHYACEDNQTACALLLIEHGASPLVVNKDGRTPLDHCAGSALHRAIKKKCAIE